MNIKSRVLDTKQFETIIQTIRTGFSLNGVAYRPNPRIATILVTQANTGLRIGDVLSLHLSDIVFEAGRHHLSIIEEKTGKKREFTLAAEIVSFLQRYALDNNIRPTAKLFDISSRAVQKHIHAATTYLGYPNVSSHAFRKFFAMQIYTKNGYNAELVRELLQHSSVAVTQRYLGVSSQLVEKALAKHVYLPDAPSSAATDATTEIL